MCDSLVCCYKKTEIGVFKLILMFWMTGAISANQTVGDFASMDACKAAAANAHMTVRQGSQSFGWAFICVQGKD
jgi:hypothetical protein